MHCAVARCTRTADGAATMMMMTTSAKTNVCPQSQRHNRYTAAEISLFLSAMRNGVRSGIIHLPRSWKISAACHSIRSCGARWWWWRVFSESLQSEQTNKSVDKRSIEHGTRAPISLAASTHAHRAAHCVCVRVCVVCVCKIL